MELLILILELIGTMAFAASGAMTALRKGMDLFGICTLGVITAVGGGVIRDLILGNTPPTTFLDPVYAAVAIATSLLLLIPGLRRLLSRDQPLMERLLFVMDTAGLGIFTVVGIRITHRIIAEPTLFLLVFVGVVTGVGGGVLRDVLVKNTPHIFIRHIYASASLAGALVCALLWNWAGDFTAMLSGAVLVVLIRMASAHFRWNCPGCGIPFDRACRAGPL